MTERSYGMPTGLMPYRGSWEMVREDEEKVERADWYLSWNGEGQPVYIVSIAFYWRANGKLETGAGAVFANPEELAEVVRGMLNQGWKIEGEIPGILDDLAQGSPTSIQ